MKVYAFKESELTAEAVVKGEKFKLAGFEDDRELGIGLSFLAGLVAKAFFDFIKIHGGSMKDDGVEDSYAAFLSSFTDIAIGDFKAILQANGALSARKEAKA